VNFFPVNKHERLCQFVLEAVSTERETKTPLVLNLSEDVSDLLTSAKLPSFPTPGHFTNELEDILI